MERVAGKLTVIVTILKWLRYHKVLISFLNMGPALAIQIINPIAKM